ncbi:MAG: CoA-binding protein [Lutibacter sp.]|uniref:CoA-binding protein n=1 Tax=Lutibacter sp. TaxID=1925666 RepID=UPI00385DBF2A
MIRKTIVLGASTNPNRYSYLAIQRLVDSKHIVSAIGRKEGEVEGVKIYKEKILFKNIDTISIYLNAKNQEEYYKYIIELNPKRVLFNPGTENPFFEQLLTKNNITFERACTLVLLSIGEY